MRNWRRFPFTWILLIAWLILRLLGISINPDNGTGITFLIVGLVIMLIEFYKSADIGLTTFKIEQATSLIAMVVWVFSVAKLTHSWSDLHLGDLIIALTLFADSWMNPCASFAMAQRNIAGNIGQDHNTEAN